jgi:peptidoglycan/LPS O-acetylase OafA/YrhL
VQPVSAGKNHLWQLESLRGFAALYLLLHHISSSYLKWRHTIWGMPFRFGQEGVLVFFLLSGFVIYYAHGPHRTTGNDFVSYLVKRGRRIYPIFIGSLMLAYLIQWFQVSSPAPVSVGQLIGNLGMLQDHPEKPGNWFPPFADNMPLWSLSYEWWFYMLFFPIHRRVPASSQKYVAFGLSILGLLLNFLHPSPLGWFLVFFLIWWAGVELAREFLATGAVTFAGQKRMLGLLAVPAIIYGLVSWHCWHTERWIGFIYYPYLEFRYFFMALVFLGLLLLWQRRQFAGFDRTLGRFVWAGGISYALYLFHYPLLCDLRLLPAGGRVLFYTDLLLRILLAFGLAWLAEVKLQKWINRWTDRWLAARKSS